MASGQPERALPLQATSAAQSRKVYSPSMCPVSVRPHSAAQGRVDEKREKDSEQSKREKVRDRETQERETKEREAERDSRERERERDTRIKTIYRYRSTIFVQGEGSIYILHDAESFR